MPPKYLKNKQRINLSIEEQKLVYEYYGVELFTLMKSPVRPDDTKPSFSTYLSSDGNLIKWKDFAYKSGGVYDFVIEVDEEVTNFIEALTKVKSIIEEQESVTKTSKTNASKPLSNDKPKINWEVIQSEKFSKFELDYWKIRGITEKQLRKENIAPLKMLLADGKYKDTSTPGNPKFIYYYLDELGNELGWKLYSPYDKDHKWLSKNTKSLPYESKLQCLNKDLIVFSSKKDKMVFDNLNLPFDTTNLIAEGIFKTFIRELSNSLSCYTNIYAWLDFDWNENKPLVFKGVERTEQIEQESKGRIKGLFLPPKESNYLLSMGVKDVDEVYLNLGKSYLNNLFLKTLNYSL